LTCQGCEFLKKTKGRKEAFPHDEWACNCGDTRIIGGIKENISYYLGPYTSFPYEYVGKNGRICINDSICYPVPHISCPKKKRRNKDEN